MKQTTKNILGVAAIVVLSAGVCYIQRIVPAEP